jgi:hypothetical protein
MNEPQTVTSRRNPAVLGVGKAEEFPADPLFFAISIIQRIPEGNLESRPSFPFLLLQSLDVLFLADD